MSRHPENSVLTPDKMRELLAILISHMDDRGGDSFGYYANGELVKDIGTAAEGVYLDKLVEARALILHTRKATVGEITAENSHPFSKGNIIGCHNGGVMNWRELNEKYERDCKVDSEHIFAHIAENKPLPELRASGAIAFMEAEDNETVNLCKFNGGSLSIVGIGPDKDTTTDVVFASTASPIISALDMAKVGEYFHYKMSEDDLFYAQHGRLFYFNPKIRLIFGTRWSDTTRSIIHRRGYNVTHSGGRAHAPWNEHEDTMYGYGGATTDTDSKDAEDGANEESKNPVTSIQGAFYDKLAKKSSEVGISTKHFIATRKHALEGYYGTKTCGLCNFHDANVKCTVTNLVYCLNCWKYVERATPFVADSYEKLLADLIERDRKEIIERMPSNCERCLSQDEVNKPRWYDPIQELIICGPCTAHHRYDTGALTLLTGMESVPAGQCCEVCDDTLPKKGVHAVLRYMSFVEGKALWVCFSCFKGEIEVDAASKSRGEKPKISARNPISLTRNTSPKVVDVEVVDSGLNGAGDMTTPQDTEMEEKAATATS